MTPNSPFQLFTFLFHSIVSAKHTESFAESMFQGILVNAAQNYKQCALYTLMQVRKYLLKLFMRLLKTATFDLQY